MNNKYAKVTKNQTCAERSRSIEQYILPLIPKNKRGFSCTFDLSEIVQCIIYKLKTGVQWEYLFIDIECFNPPFSWQLVYYYYRQWSRSGVFEEMFELYLSLQKDKLDTENLNLDGTHSYVKRDCESAGYQYRKKGKTSNVLIMTDGGGIPISIGNVQSGNHNDLYEILPEFAAMTKSLNRCGVVVQNSILNADKGFDSKKLRRACRRRNIMPNIKENSRNRKKSKRGRKRFFNPEIYKRRFVNERTFAWLDSFRTLLVRFDKLDENWLSWHYLAFTLILLKVLMSSICNFK
jgi:transposase